jgi:hypothetical protein
MRADRGIGVLLAAVLLGACTSNGGTPIASAPVPTRTVTHTRTTTPDPAAAAPISTGPTTVATAPRCPFLAQQSAANRVGMRLDRITVLTSAGRTVGCRFYALQNSPLHDSEHLPGPHQPAVELTTTRYRSAAAAHNAFVLTARHGTNPQQADISLDNPGVCYQIDFYPRDNGKDWACAYSVGKTAVVVRTVVVSPALNVILVAREVAKQL